MKSKTFNRLMMRDRRPGDEPALICLTGEVGEGFHYWRGASGARYLHTVFALLDCPELPKANYILVHCNAEGARRALAIGQIVEDVNSLNLAHLRRRAALLGANEIHIHMLAETAMGRHAVETDLGLRHLPSSEHGSELAKAG